MTDRVRSLSPGHRCAYTRSVMAADECPSTVWTCLTLAPPEMSAEAVKCLSACVSTSTPAAAVARFQTGFQVR